MMKIKKLLKSRKGETLIEVITSCAIFGILIVIMTTLLMNAAQITTEATRIYKGDNLIAEFYDGDGGPPSITPTATETKTPVAGELLITFDTDGLLGVSAGDLKLKSNVTYSEADPGLGYNLKTVNANSIIKIEP